MYFPEGSPWLLCLWQQSPGPCATGADPYSIDKQSLAGQGRGGLPQEKESPSHFPVLWEPISLLSASALLYTLQGPIERSQESTVPFLDVLVYNRPPPAQDPYREDASLSLASKGQSSKVQPASLAGWACQSTSLCCTCPGSSLLCPSGPLHSLPWPPHPLPHLYLPLTH